MNYKDMKEKYTTPETKVIKMETEILAASSIQGQTDIDNGPVDNGESGSAGAARSKAFDPWSTWSE